MRHNQNRRSRGRNRKGPNPLTRSYESNGPDVKVRGTAMHIAEKYMSLARDAVSSGDNVAAENYLQHAEHYNRIVAAAQAQQQAQQPQFRDAGEREWGERDDEGEEDDRFYARGGRDRFGFNGENGRNAAEDDESDDDEGANEQPGRPRQEFRPEPRQDARPEQGASPGSAETGGDASEDAPMRPRRRRSRQPRGEITAAVNGNGAAEGDGGESRSDGDLTRDGEAALAAFPD